MKRMRVFGLCLVTAFAISAIVVSGASAAASPEFGRCKAAKGTGKFKNSGCTLLAKGLVEEKKFEWSPTVVKNKFTAKQKAETIATLETVGGTKITCTSEQNSGAEYNLPKKVSKIVAEFSGCETSKIPCNSAGEPSGHITTHSLGGLLGVEKLFVKEGKIEESKNKLEVQLTAEGGGALANFTCSTISVEVKGCVAHPISGGKMLLTATEKFTASKGEQKPDKFLGGPVDECALESNGGAGFEEAGQTITAIVTNEEKIEANPKPEGE